MNNIKKFFSYIIVLMLVFYMFYILFISINCVFIIFKTFYDTLPSDVIVETAKLDNLDFSKISVDINSSNITIINGSEFNVKTNNDKIKFEVIDNTLHIKEKGKRRKKSSEYKLNLNIPEEMINLLDIKVSNGNIDIKNINVNDLNIKVKHGNVNIKKSIFNEINSDLKIGDFNFDGKINESIYVNNIIGAITLMVNDDIENYKVDTANIIGSILINGKNNIVVNDGDKMISVKNKIGSVSVNF